MTLSKDRDGNVCTRPSKNNPFMNVTMNELATNPSRPKACPINSKVKHTMKNYFDHNLYRDVDDIFHKKASDRQYYTMPSTEVPNDATAYANWLYGTKKTCKEGNGTQCYTNIYHK